MKVDYITFSKLFRLKFKFKKLLGMVVQVYNLSYSGSRDLEDYSLRPVMEKT
jgi:hypothetical protein